ncbi:protein ALP1-like [Aphis craccivora]|uniref:Protein ALP1-like n=1 Tax=Aphis craccivora TaxID=307492 RepID=A0A6G0WMK2_APHCR|nr:protein ALP1-like [Aphis craccivora]
MWEVFFKNSDGGIMTHSKLGKALDENKLNVAPKKELPGTTNDVPCVIISDEAFPLKTYLLKPYPGKQLNCNEKRVYNYRLCRARRVVEKGCYHKSLECIINECKLNQKMLM